MLSESWCPPWGMNERADQPCSLRHIQRSQIFHQAVAERAVELQDIHARAHPPVADQVSRILGGEEVLPRRHGVVVMPSEFGLKREVERVARFFVPVEIVRRERLRVGDGGFKVEFPVGVHREVPPLAHDLEHRLDSLHVVIEAIRHLSSS